MRGWIKEAGSRAELRGMLVRAIAIAIAYISLWYVHVPRSVLVCLELNIWYVHVPLEQSRAVAIYFYERSTNMVR